MKYLRVSWASIQRSYEEIRYVLLFIYFFSPLLSFSLIFHKQRNESSIVPLVVFVSLAFSTSHECPRVLL